MRTDTSNLLYAYIVRSVWRA